jgi:hypothetical protein
MRKYRNDLTADYLRSILNYDPETGIFTWRKKIARQVVVGATAGCLRGKNQVGIGIGKYRYLASRLAYLWMTGEWPPDEIDHRNRKSANNRWENLRAANRSQQNMNRGRVPNKSLPRGIRIRTKHGFYVRIKVKGKEIQLGHFPTLPEAIAARDEGERIHFGEFRPSD